MSMNTSYSQVLCVILFMATVVSSCAVHSASGESQAICLNFMRRLCCAPGVALRVDVSVTKCLSTALYSRLSFPIICKLKYNIQNVYNGTVEKYRQEVHILKIEVGEI